MDGRPVIDTVVDAEREHEFAEGRLHRIRWFGPYESEQTLGAGIGASVLVRHGLGLSPDAIARSLVAGVPMLRTTAGLFTASDWSIEIEVLTDQFDVRMVNRGPVASTGRLRFLLAVVA